ncbi:hypothetical protein Trydic_g21760 [Trypoxylus dichotomus]
MEPPTPPDEADCCNSGCSPCILDIYEERLKKYNTSKTDRTSLKNCISETSYTVFKLIEKIKHTENTYFLIFEYCKPFRKAENENGSELCIKYKPGQHFMLRTPLNGIIDHFTRAYTPIPFDNLNPLSFCILVKIYEGGMMSKYLRNMKIGCDTLWRGPYCDFTINYTYKYILMMAQGTGIAPLYSILKEMLDNDECNTFIKLFFCCRSSGDILLREELYKCLAYWNFTYEVFLSTKDDVKVKYNEVVNYGKLNRGDIWLYLDDKKDNGVQVLICGSEMFSKDVGDDLLNMEGIDVFVF